MVNQIGGGHRAPTSRRARQNVTISKRPDHTTAKRIDRMTFSSAFTPRFPLVWGRLGRPHQGQDSTAWVYSDSCSVREPREGYGGFGVPEGTRYLLAQRPRPSRARPRRSRSGAHGPCHQPVSPFCGSRDRVSRHHERREASFERPRWRGSHAVGVGLVVPSPHPVLQGYCEHRMVDVGGEDPNWFPD